MSMELINRTELLKAIDTWDKFGVDDTNHLFRLDNLSLPHYVPYIHYDDVIKCIKGMSSVKQEPCEAKEIYGRGYVDGQKALAEHIRLCKEEQEPKQGHWINKPNIYGVAYCSECDYELKIDDTNYCPNCGARMSE